MEPLRLSPSVMRKAIASFEQEFAEWGISLPARDVVERQPGHLARHGWAIDYSFGSDAFGDYLEYHARHVAPGKPTAERHTRIYHNGEKNFIPAPDEPAADGASGETDAIPAAASPTPAEEVVHHRATLPPWEVILEEATGSSARRSTRSPFRERVRAIAGARFPGGSGDRGTSRIAPREDGPSRAREPAPIVKGWQFDRRGIQSLAIGVGGALLLSAVVLGGVRLLRGRPHATPGSVATDASTLPPVVVQAPEVLGFSADTAAARLTQPLVGTPNDPNRAEIVRPDHGMTPIIPTDPKNKKKNKPAPTTRGEKFHVP